MSYFVKAVDRRSRKAMISFLENHERYNTLNSNNRSTSYAHCIKFHRLGLTSEQVDAAYKLLGVEDYWDHIDEPIANFTRAMHGDYTIGTNGRSGGYLVVYHSRYESTEHKSWCPSCGQRNFKRVARPLEGAEAIIGAEILRSNSAWFDKVYLGQSAIQALTLSDDEKLTLIARLKRELKDCTLGNRCGRCGAEGDRGRVNFAQSPRHLVTYSGRALDQDEDFTEWSIDQLRRRVELVTAFDQACDEIRSAFIDLLEEYTPVEKTVMVPKKVTVLEPRASA
ncbi:cysteine protease (plasmid) [Burkholderia vietnamiensis]|uniref:Uncharacterized protein n=1 Tax=Burkholderia vietnamiensis (strain G4 / LMG 22486) TaxID=269482 RepID=A4JUF4_BURVG|nr:conserved hypothetical protein [Burkholderia vietnamiensis G4]MCB4349929.1 cysteine protease [Burkholderia vietnamiensis]